MSTKTTTAAKIRTSLARTRQLMDLLQGETEAAFAALDSAIETRAAAMAALHKTVRQLDDRDGAAGAPPN